MGEHLVLVDLDETLFDTVRFKSLIGEYLSDSFGIDRDRYKETYSDFQPEAGLYDFWSHLEFLTSRTRKELYDSFVEYVHNSEIPLLHSDAGEFLDANNEKDLAILTFGMDDFQNLKIDQIPRLSEYPRLVIQTSKSEFLDNNMTPTDQGIGFSPVSEDKFYEKIWVIDDRVDMFATVDIDGLEQFRIRREGGKYSSFETPTHVTEVTSLNEIT